MCIEVKMFPHLQHLSSDGESMIVFDVGTSLFVELDKVTATILEEAVIWGKWSDEACESAKKLLLFRGISESAIDESMQHFSHLQSEGVFCDTNRSFIEKRMIIGIRAMTLNVAHTCQLGCIYCFASGGDYGTCTIPEMMSSYIGKLSVDFLLQNGDPAVNEYSILFFGGEPLLNWELIEELTHYVEKRAKELEKVCRLSVTTNGILLDKKRLDFLMEHEFGILISIDGDEQLHNHLRPHIDEKINSFAETKKAIDLIRHSPRSKVSGRATITAYCPDPQKLANYLLSAGINNVGLQMVSGGDKDKPWMLSHSDLRKMSVGTSDMIIEDVFDSALFLSRIRNRDRCVPYGCNYLCGTMSVDSLGRIYSCHRLTGNDDHLIGCIQEGIDEMKVQRIANMVNANSMLGCRSCWARNLCGAHCAANNYVMTKDGSTPSSFSCYQSQANIEASIERYLMELKM